MPAALSPAEQHSKTWWSLSKSPSAKDLRQAYVQEKSPPAQPKASGKLNSLASAMGFKSKKQSPSLAIQEPPAPISDITPIPRPNVAPTSSTSTMNRPSSKSVSSTRSRGDSVGPRTPVDFQRENRHSLLTLSDTDPFAGRPIIAPPVPHLPSDPNRLSAYSNSSVTDIVPKKNDSVPPFKRVSYASSSSTSNNHAIDSPTFASATSSNGASEYRQLINKRSVPSLQINKRSEALQRQMSATPASISGSKPGSSSMLLGPQRRSQIDSVAPLRPKLRARGMTDTGASQRAGFFVEEPSVQRKLSLLTPLSSDLSASQEVSSSTSPRVVIRQPSISRIHSPPSAPPTQRLPPPPLSIDEPQRPTARISASSSSISFASSDSLMSPPHILSDHDSLFPHQRGVFSHSTLESDLDSPISFAQPKDVPIPPRTLKKALSQSSLSRRIHTSLAPTPKSPVDGAEKSPRKPRIFTHPRLPIPPIPLSVRPSSASGPTPFPSTSDGSVATPKSDKRTSHASSTGRKRLFSNSSRPSTSHHSPREDDNQSVFSLRSDVDAHLSHFKPWLTTPKTSSSSSFWDEGVSDPPPLSPVRSNQEYHPQAIISREEVEKLEASVDSYSPERTGIRARGFSILSSSTTFSDTSRDAEHIPAGLSPPPSSRPSSKQKSAMRMSSNSLSGQSPVWSQSSSLSARRNDDDSNRMQSLGPTPSQVAARPSTSPGPGMVSLPPPPRRPRKATLVTQSQPDIPEMTVAAPTTTILPPRVPSVHKTASIRSNSKGTVEKSIHRRSIMRKPSFLEIDDDTDHEIELDERITGSFLDLARESFDTTRSDK